jgi:hypothetical protein
MTRTRTAYDCRHAKSVLAWGLLHDGKMAGRLVADYSDNPAGSVCTLTLSVWEGPLKDLPVSTPRTARTGGYGYCKASAAFAHIVGDHKLHSAGMSTVRSWLEDRGYDVVDVLGA